MSVVLAIVALVLGGGLASFVSWTSKKGYENTEKQLALLQEALIAYKKTYGRLPCPGDITDVQTDTAFGVESGDPGVCTPANTQFTSYNDAIGGLIPVRTLGLPDDMAFDSWGSRLLYYVDRRFTDNHASVKYKGVNGQLKVHVPIPAVTTYEIASVVYVVISHGPNRHGAYPRGGGTIRMTSRDPADATGANDQYWGMELNNCRCNDGSGATQASYLGAWVPPVFNQAPFLEDPAKPKNTFDDIVVYNTSKQLELSGK